MTTVECILEFLSSAQPAFPEMAAWFAESINAPRGIARFIRRSPYFDARPLAGERTEWEKGILPDGRFFTMVHCPEISDATRSALYQHMTRICAACAAEDPEFAEPPAVDTVVPGNALPVPPRLAPLLKSARDLIDVLSDASAEYECKSIQGVLRTGMIHAYVTTHTDAIVELTSIAEAAGLPIFDIIDAAITPVSDDPKAVQTKVAALLPPIIKMASNSARRTAFMDKITNWHERHNQPERSPVHAAFAANSSTIPPPPVWFADARLLASKPVALDFCNHYKIDPAVITDAIDRMEAEFVQTGNSTNVWNKIVSEVCAWAQAQGKTMMEGGIPNAGGANAGCASMSLAAMNHQEGGASVKQDSVYSDAARGEICAKLRAKLEAKQRKKAAAAVNPNLVSEKEVADYFHKSLEEWVAEIEGCGDNSAAANQSKAKTKTAKDKRKKGK